MAPSNVAPTPRPPLDVQEQFLKHRAYRAPGPELQSLLDAHALWVKDSREGAQLTDEAAGCEFENLMLDGVCLRGARLISVDFLRCSMVGADLSQACLEGTHFRDTDLTSASFRKAILTRVKMLDGSKIDGADFFEAEVTGAKVPTIKMSIGWRQVLPELFR